MLELGCLGNCDRRLSTYPLLKAREEAEHATQTIEQLAFRNGRNSRLIAKVR
ncbi:hypothetical protein [Pseudomonas lini]